MSYRGTSRSFLTLPSDLLISGWFDLITALNKEPGAPTGGPSWCQEPTVTEWLPTRLVLC